MLNNINKGFTLLEVLVSIFLLTIGIGGIFVLVTQTMVSSQLTEARLEATYLAQEGIEIVRNFRDTNFLKIYKGEGSNWLEGLESCQNGCEADFNDAGLAAFDDRFLKIDEFYNYETGSNTSFKRKIIVSDLTDLNEDGLWDRAKVLTEVSWQERGRAHKVSAQEFLYKWWQ